EEKLLRAIFGDKAGDVKDASLKIRPSVKGVVIEKKLFEKAIKDRKSRADEKNIITQLDEEYNSEMSELKKELIDKLYTIVNGKTSQGVVNYYNEEIVPKGTKFTIKILEKINDYSFIDSKNWTTSDEINDLV